jgi:hypothetical protein
VGWGKADGKPLLTAEGSQKIWTCLKRPLFATGMKFYFLFWLPGAKTVF